jgi:hypothetical protein
MIDWSSRFWRKVRVDADGCWRWTASVNRNGYGQFGVGSRGDGVVLAHRHAYSIAIAPIPAGMEVRHRCDVPGCVNPAHLEIGTHAENMRDMKERGRAAKGRAVARCGEDGGNVKLTTPQVLEIRAAYASGGVTQKSLAAKYGVTVQNVSLIVNRKAWAHLVDGA